MATATKRPKTSKPLLQLKRALPGCVRTDSGTLRTASMDNARIPGNPDAVIFAQTDAAIGKVLELANQYAIPVTVRGAGSATTGAASPVRGGWVLDLSQRRKITIDATQGIATVEPGATVAAVDKAAGKRGWFYPPDPSSKNYATIGGAIANNAGGLRGAKYGVTRDYVLGLEGFLPTGAFVRWGAPLKKYASGYNLRDLLIGSEGTLGVITKAHLKLVPRPETTWTALVAFKNERDAIAAALALMKSCLVPSIMEFLDRQTVSCATAFLGKTIDRSISEAALLLIELDGNVATVEQSRSRVLDWASRHAVQHFDEARSTDAAEQLWQVRRNCSEAMFQLGNTKVNEDIVVPAKAYAKLIQFTQRLSKQIGLATPTFGHIADGNFHVHIMYDRDNPEHLNRVEYGVGQLMSKVVEWGGAITGEHGIGLAKSPFLRWQHSEVEIATMQAIKQLLDPNNILNPGKIFEVTKIWKLQKDYSVRFPWQKR